MLTAGDIVELVAGLPGVTAGEATGAPEVAWGDSFFFYDPNDDEADRMMPFATIVTKDYDGFDTASNINRPGLFRLNIAVGRTTFQALLGYPPAAHAEHHSGIDYTVVDDVLPHPVYAVQGWVSILNPAEATTARTHTLLTDARARAVSRYRPRG
ncbi:MAG TPA: DUF6194 family protein [Pseudonocardiaceae bacterium]|nr:DUF6194 family protein [Pseudonocardiaceae bacterium]